MRLRLKEERGKKKLTQAEVAKQLKISLRTYQHIENGDRFPREKLLYKMIKFFGIEDMDLFKNTYSPGKERGQITKNICNMMNDLGCKKYDLCHIRAIRSGILLELEDRKIKKIKIKINREGKNLILERIAIFSSIKNKISKQDVALYKKCSRIEFEHRTGKSTWGIPRVRKQYGCTPHTGREAD